MNGSSKRKEEKRERTVYNCYPTTDLSVRSILHPFVRPFVRPFVHSFVCSFVHSFIHSIRCYRAEASQNQQDKGLYRVHQFNKVKNQNVLHKKRKYCYDRHFTFLFKLNSILPLKFSCQLRETVREYSGSSVRTPSLNTSGTFYLCHPRQVEMFMVTAGDEESSQAALNQIHAIERDMFDQLGQQVSSGISLRK